MALIADLIGLIVDIAEVTVLMLLLLGSLLCVGPAFSASAEREACLMELLAVSLVSLLLTPRVILLFLSVAGYATVVVDDDDDAFLEGELLLLVLMLMTLR